MEPFLRFLIAPLLTQPDRLVIVVSSASTVTVHVDQSDMGRVIGKHGNLISALRHLLRLYSTLHHLPLTTLTLAESQNGSAAAAESVAA